MTTSFVDTNVLVYLVDRDEPDKRATARQVLARGEDLVTSPQVLGEFYVVSTRRLRRPIPVDLAQRMVDRFSRLRIVPIEGELVKSAIRISQRTQLAYWDSLIVAAAAAARRCERLLTEDLNHGQVIEGVRIENPFL